MPVKGIPDRWEVYNALGRVITNTKFIAFKVPLKERLCQGLPLPERFTPAKLIEDLPELGFVIDLTNTTRYYNPQDFLTRSIHYKKIYCEGHRIPSQKVTDEFLNTVDEFLSTNPEGKLIGVHCTHGLNRTGYLVCRYMIDRLGFTCDDAVREFEQARGYQIERKEYIRDLAEIFRRRSGSWQPAQRDQESHPARSRNEMRFWSQQRPWRQAHFVDFRFRDRGQYNTPNYFGDRGQYNTPNYFGQSPYSTYHYDYQRFPQPPSEGYLNQQYYYSRPLQLEHNQYSWRRDQTPTYGNSDLQQRPLYGNSGLEQRPL